MKFWTIYRRAICVGAPMLAVTSIHAEGLLDTLKKAVTGDYTVRGRVQVQDGQWLTCFNDIKAGYLGPANLARPGGAQLDPNTGTMTAATAAIPAFILTRDGVTTPNDCDALANQHLLVLVLPTTSGAASGSAGTGCNERDRTGCVTPDMTKDYIAAHSNEIIACQAHVLTERDYAKLEAGRQGAPASGGDTERVAAVAKLQQDTAAKFKAIQSQSAAPAAAAPTQSAEDLAWDGAKLCGLKPAYMMTLKAEAVQFLRIDSAADRIVLSEFAGGARQEVALDGNGFAQRATFNANAIGQGGDSCGRAF